MMLAIIADNLTAPSETFIRDHAKLIAPDETIAIVRRESQGVLPPESTYLLERAADIESTILERIMQKAIRYILPPKVPQLGSNERMELMRILDRNSVSAVLIEHGHVATEFCKTLHQEKVPFFVHFHGYDANVLGDEARFKRAYVALFKQATGIIVASRFMAARIKLLGCHPTKINVVPMGIDTDFFSATKRQPGPPRVVTVSRLTRQKGVRYAIESFAKVLQTMPHAKFDIVGDGPERKNLERWAADFGISDKVVFHGALPSTSVRDLLQSADLYIQHCVTIAGEGIEGLGISILEAMACELPVIATSHGGLSETILPNCTGFLVNEYDTRQMAKHIIELLDNRKFRCQMGTAGRRRVQACYSQEASLQKMRGALGWPRLA
ncbi:glycosyltransferase family 4 protein [Altererythrobacter aquiaggeris]|uniref:glycosyltransferase family 4 protein n=1 Tax=Aestuarierythrobacter aquiaggeris TaxID=1898396 RepID=UPI0030198486